MIKHTNIDVRCIIFVFII